MAFIRLNDKVLNKEYCIKPKDKDCPNRFCYDELHQCRYWHQEFITLYERNRLKR